LENKIILEKKLRAIKPKELKQDSQNLLSTILTSVLSAVKSGKSSTVTLANSEVE
jgi:hypothetical protein